MDQQESNDGLPPQELLQRAREYHHRPTLPPKEYEALMELGAQLASPLSSESRCFILGSYDEDANEKQKLIYLKEEIENWTEVTCRAYLMEDFPDGLHPMVKFKLIADHSDYLIGICEHDHGGFQLELGMLIALTKYFDQCYLLKRTYSDEKVEHEKYNWMLDAGAFEMFDYGGRLREWENQREYRVKIATLLSELFG